MPGAVNIFLQLEQVGVIESWKSAGWGLVCIVGWCFLSLLLL